MQQLKTQWVSRYRKVKSQGFDNFNIVITFVKSLGEYGNGSYGVLNKQEIKKYLKA